MVKRIICTVILVIIGVFYSCMSVKPVGPFATLQEQDVQAQTGTVGSGGKTGSQEGGKLRALLDKLIPKRIQLSLTEKSNQILKAWTGQQSVHGVINVLQTADFGALSVKPGESLAPYDRTHKIFSFMFMIALGVIVFGKTLLSISIPVVCAVLIPIFIIYNIVALWKTKDVKGAHRIVIAAFVTSILITFAVPVVLKVSILLDDIVFSKHVNEIVVSLEDSQKSAGRIDADLRSGRRSSAAIQNHIVNTKKLSNTVVNDSFSYLLVFAILYILIPVFSGIGLYKFTRFLSKKILKK